jgi:hypothetical protein
MRTVATASMETDIHIPFTSANCRVMWVSLIQIEGLLASTPSILRIRNIFASTQMCPSIRPFSLRLRTMRNTPGLSNLIEITGSERNSRQHLSFRLLDQCVGSVTNVLR